MVTKRHVKSLFGLSARQLLVLKLISEDWTVQGIALLMKRSCKTVEYHIASVKRKIKQFSTVEITKFCIREGITPL